MRIVVILLLLWISPALASDLVADLAVADTDLNYPAIEFMSASNSTSLQLFEDLDSIAEDSPQAEQLRVVVYLSEIYQSVVLEKVTTGIEGCCAKVQWRQTFDLSLLSTHFDMPGETTGFIFTSWLSPQSFSFTYKNESFVATLLSDNQIRVSRA